MFHRHHAIGIGSGIPFAFNSMGLHNMNGVSDYSRLPSKSNEAKSRNHTRPHFLSIYSQSNSSTSLPSFNELLTSIPFPKESQVTSPNYIVGNNEVYLQSVPVIVANNNYSMQPHVFPSAPYHIQLNAMVNPIQQNPGQNISIQSHSHISSQTNSQTNSICYSPSDSPLINLSTVSSPISNVSPASNHSPVPKFEPQSNLDSKQQNARKHCCKICSRSFTTSGHLARHNRIHTGERKNVCPWPSCNARFARQDNCMQHYKTHTNGKSKRLKYNFKRNLRSKSR